MVMGCYGIGVSRVVAAAVEQHHDQNGICWPKTIAPFQVNVLPLQMKREDVCEAAENIYQKLLTLGVDVLIDDRNERAGSKFKDADLIGAPVRIAVGGKGLDQGMIEVRSRHETESKLVPVTDIINETMRRLELAR